MDPTELQLQILGLARAKGSVDVAALALQRGIAPETVGRDPRCLVDEGTVKGTRGGAYPVGCSRSRLRSITARQPIWNRSAGSRRLRVHVFSGRRRSTSTKVSRRSWLTRSQRLPDGHALAVVILWVPAAEALTHRPAISVIMRAGRVRG
jgi:DeoR family fructose operon transcriptional repressor